MQCSPAGRLIERPEGSAVAATAACGGVEDDEREEQGLSKAAADDGFQVFGDLR
jgi:hypothetical protein